jgi:hypothetical protein
MWAVSRRERKNTETVGMTIVRWASGHSLCYYEYSNEIYDGLKFLFGEGTKIIKLVTRIYARIGTRQDSVENFRIQMNGSQRFASSKKMVGRFFTTRSDLSCRFW